MKKIENMNLFIVPNRLGTFAEATKNSIRGTGIFHEMAKRNGMPNGIPKWMPMIDIWTCTPKCDNCEDHFMRIDNDSHRQLANIMPAQLFDGKKEGDVITLILPFSVIRRTDDDDIDETAIEWIECEITLNQLNYRYRMYGRFEDALDYVTT